MCERIVAAAERAVIWLGLCGWAVFFWFHPGAPHNQPSPPLALCASAMRDGYLMTCASVSRLSDDATWLLLWSGILAGM